jgi:hypothetical protein
MYLRPDHTNPTFTAVADTLDQPTDADESILKLGS